ncbi:MAG: Uma2 family endonuclease, partial [Armatimonadetes bacterium]|nr:Uma2 family endonuclease [Armatimonadota bacterium]
MAVTKKVWTDEEILSLKCEGKVEIVGGELKIITPAGLEQEDAGAALVAALRPYVRQHNLGRIYMSQA